MNASIGPSCSHHLDGLAQDSGERFLQALLHAVAVWLNLPAVVARAVVGKGDEETNQSNLRFDDLQTPSKPFGPPSLTLPNCSAFNGQLPRGEASCRETLPLGGDGGGSFTSPKAMGIGLGRGCRGLGWL